jgi:hypothetical protein
VPQVVINYLIAGTNFTLIRNLDVKETSKPSAPLQKI